MPAGERQWSPKPCDGTFDELLVVPVAIPARDRDRQSASLAVEVASVSAFFPGLAIRQTQRQTVLRFAVVATSSDDFLTVVDRLTRKDPTMNPDLMLLLVAAHQRELYDATRRRGRA